MSPGLILPTGTPIGVPYGEALGLRPDVLLDIDVTRNRPDCLGYVGIARDLAAQLGIELRLPTPTLQATGAPRRAPVELIDGDRCGRFTSTVMSGVVVGPSAAWMQQRLTDERHLTLVRVKPPACTDMRTASAPGSSSHFESSAASESDMDPKYSSLTWASR